MDMTFTGRGVQVTDRIRATAEQRLAVLGRMEPRATSLEIELIDEHHPRPSGLKRAEISLKIPRKTFRAHAEAQDVPTAIDRARDKLERQLRDHHGRKKTLHAKGALGYAEAATAETDVG